MKTKNHNQSSHQTIFASESFIKVVKDLEDIKRKFNDLAQDHEKYEETQDSPEGLVMKKDKKYAESDPLAKRLAQNRSAQKAFRERREDYVKNLEEKVKKLEEAHNKSKEENQRLLESIRELEKNPSLIHTPVSYSSPYINQTLANSYSEHQFQNGFQADSLAPAPFGTISSDMTISSSNISIPGQNTSNNIGSFSDPPLFPVSNAFSMTEDYMLPTFSAYTNNQYINPLPTLSEGTSSFFDPSTMLFDPQGFTDTSFLNLDPSKFSPINFLPTESSLQASTNSHVQTPPSSSTQSETPDSSETDVSLASLLDFSKPPPTREQLYKLAAKHKIINAQLKTQTFSIDELCEAMRKKATCSAVQEYLVSFLGEEELAKI